MKQIFFIPQKTDGLPYVSISKKPAGLYDDNIMIFNNRGR